jgi:broad specificity phosphatase PhoE
MMKPGTRLASLSKAMLEGYDVTTHIHFIRHGNHALLGRVLCGRMHGVALDEQGCLQMKAAAEVIKSTNPHAVQSSPQRRALQSAKILAAVVGLSVEIVPAFDEIDMGRWTGMEFSNLAEDIQWRHWNERRASTTPPEGESMARLQRRVVDYVETLRFQEGSIVIVSHAEPIRATLMYYLGIPLDRFHAVEVNPASVSTVTFNRNKALVSRINYGAGV